jgi:hypothetical protein
VTDPRPDPDSEVAGESEYGNDTGFAGTAAPSEATAGPDPEPAAAEDADEDDPGRGAD